MSYWTAVNTFFVLGSLAMYFAVTFTMYSNGMFLILPSAFPFIGEWSTHNLAKQLSLKILLCAFPHLCWLVSVNMHVCSWEFFFSFFHTRLLWSRGGSIIQMSWIILPNRVSEFSLVCFHMQNVWFTTQTNIKAGSDQSCVCTKLYWTVSWSNF